MQREYEKHSTSRQRARRAHVWTALCGISAMGLVSRVTPVHTVVSPLLHRRCNNHRTQLWPFSNPFAVAIVPKIPHGILVVAIAQGEAAMNTSRSGNAGVHPFTRTRCVDGRQRFRRDTLFIHVCILGCCFGLCGGGARQRFNSTEERVNPVSTRRA